jgi:predicted  nucleic acid-binding Zn-ribbon protein
MKHANAIVLDAEQRVKDLDTKSRQLENDFYAQSDGYRRDGVIKPAWDKARDDLAKARSDIDTARKSLEDLAEEARRSGAPPGWLR